MIHYYKGMRVKAVVDITEGNGFPDPNAKVGENGYIYAVSGDSGVVEYIDEDGCPTVRFDRTGSATIVADSEIVIMYSGTFTF